MRPFRLDTVLFSIEDFVFSKAVCQISIQDTIFSGTDESISKEPVVFSKTDCQISCEVEKTSREEKEFPEKIVTFLSNERGLSGEHLTPLSRR